MIMLPSAVRMTPQAKVVSWSIPEILDETIPIVPICPGDAAHIDCGRPVPLGEPARSSRHSPHPARYRQLRRR